MILIKQFAPVSAEKAGLKEDIKFRVSELAPFIPMFVFTGPPRYASKLEDEGTFRRLTATELKEKATTNSTLYVDNGVNSGSALVIGDVGLAPASQSLIQSELERSSVEIEKKSQELSSLVILRRKQDSDQAAKIGAPSDAFLADKIENSKKGEVLAIEATTGFPYLFNGRPIQSRVGKLIGNDLMQVESPGKFSNDAFLSMVLTDEKYLAEDTKPIYYWEIDKITSPSSVQINYVAVDPTGVVGLEARVTGQRIDILFDRTNPPTSEAVKSLLDQQALHLVSTTATGNGIIAPASQGLVLTLLSSNLALPVTLTSPNPANSLTFTASPSYKGSDITVEVVSKDPSEIISPIVITTTSEKQKLDLNHVPTSGTFDLTLLENIQFVPLSIPTTLNAAFKELWLLDEVIVTGSYASGFTVTFAGTDGLQDHEQLAVLSNSFRKNVSITCTPSTLVEGNPSQDEVQKLMFSSVPEEGTFTITYNGIQTTTALAFNATAATVQQALRDLASLSDVVVSGNFTIGFTVTFAGSAGLQEQPQLTVASSLLKQAAVAVTILTTVPGTGSQNEVQTISFDGTPVEGTLTLQYKKTITALPFSTTSSSLQTALQVIAPGTVVTGDVPSFTIDYSEASGGKNFPQLIAQNITLQRTEPVAIQVATLRQGSGSQTELQKVTFNKVPTSGSFTLTLAGETTTPILFSASTSAVQSALQALPAAPTVTVLGDFTSGFAITFTNILNPAQMTATSSLSVTSSTTATPSTVISGAKITLNINRTTPPSLSTIKSTVEGSTEANALVVVSLTGSGSQLLFDTQPSSSTIVTTLSVTPEAKSGDLTFTRQPPTIKIKATAFSKAVAAADIFGDALRATVLSKPLYAAIAGVPILRKSKVGEDVPTLEEYAALIEKEIPLTAIYAPVTKDQGPIGNFLGNLNLSSLNVTLYDDDGAVMLIQNGEAQPGSSVQYKLHREPNLDEEIEIGDVDVTIKLSSPPARVPIRGQLVRGAREIALGVNIATTPSRLTPIGSGAAKSNISEGSLADVATFGLGPKLDKFQDKIGETIKNYSKEPPAKGEYYFNFQAKNAQGESIDLNKYGTIRLFDEVTFVYLDSKGKPIPLQKTSIVGVIEANNVIAIKDGITALAPPKSTVLVEIPQTPLNPGRKYRIVISCLDKGLT